MTARPATLLGTWGNHTRGPAPATKETEMRRFVGVILTLLLVASLPVLADDDTRVMEAAR